MRELFQETADSVTAGAASVPVVAENRQRKRLEIANPTAVGMFLGLGRAAVIGEGLYIPPQSVYSFSREADNLWRGAVNIIAASGAGHVIPISEWQ